MANSYKCVQRKQYNECKKRNAIQYIFAQNVPKMKRTVESFFDNSVCFISAAFCSDMPASRVFSPFCLSDFKGESGWQTCDKCLRQLQRREKSLTRDRSPARLASVTTYSELWGSDCSKVRHLSRFTYTVSQQSALRPLKTVQNSTLLALLLFWEMLMGALVVTSTKRF